MWRCKIAKCKKEWQICKSFSGFFFKKKPCEYRGTIFLHTGHKNQVFKYLCTKLISIKLDCIVFINALCCEQDDLTDMVLSIEDMTIQKLIVINYIRILFSEVSPVSSIFLWHWLYPYWPTKKLKTVKYIFPFLFCYIMCLCRLQI